MALMSMPRAARSVATRMSKRSLRKTVECGLAAVLRHVALQRGHAVALLLQDLGQVAGPALGAREDEHLAGGLALEHLEQQRALDVLTHGYSACETVAAGREWPISTTTGSRRIWSASWAVLRHGGREEQRLPLRRQLRDDAPHVGQKSHVAHLVGLIKHQHLDAAQVDGAAIHVVEQPARAGHDHVDAAPELLVLRPLAHAAVQRRAAQAHDAAELRAGLPDLVGQFARRREDEAARAAGAHQARAVGQAMGDGQHERRRLAGAGLGDAEHIVPFHDDRDGLLLDGRWLGVAGLGDRRQQAGLKGERGEFGRLRIQVQVSSARSGSIWASRGPDGFGSALITALEISGHLGHGQLLTDRIQVRHAPEEGLCGFVLQDRDLPTTPGDEHLAARAFAPGERGIVKAPRVLYWSSATASGLCEGERVRARRHTGVQHAASRFSLTRVRGDPVHRRQKPCDIAAEQRPRPARVQARWQRNRPSGMAAGTFGAPAMS
jgi:hypothetical protein